NVCLDRLQEGLLILGREKLGIEASTETLMPGDLVKSGEHRANQFVQWAIRHSQARCCKCSACEDRSVQNVIVFVLLDDVDQSCTSEHALFELVVAPLESRIEFEEGGQERLARLNLRQALEDPDRL